MNNFEVVLILSYQERVLKQAKLGCDQNSDLFFLAYLILWIYAGICARSNNASR